MDSAVRALADKISGDLVFAENPGKTLKKWRQIFEVSQKDLALKLGVSPSVISDYEGERRKSPGIAFIRKIIKALLEIDRERGFKTLSKYKDIFYDLKMDVILDMKEYEEPVSSFDFAQIIEAENLTNHEKVINGHTIIDSVRAILTLNSYDFYKLYGFTTERALCFTKVTSGKGPMVAVRVANLKPAVVVLHGLPPENVDSLAIEIAKLEKLHLMTTTLALEEMTKKLRKYFK